MPGSERLTLPLSPSGPPLPELWLIGKAGAGKTTLFRALTGEGLPGDGLRPHTREAQRAPVPPRAPVLELVDLPGIGLETELPPLGADVSILALARLDDPVQARLAAALKAHRKAMPGRRILLALSGSERLPDLAERARAAASIRRQIEAAAGGPLPVVEIGLDEGGAVLGLEALTEALAELLPGAMALSEARRQRLAEAEAFADLRPLVWRYALGAGGSDALPVVGALTVPAAQAALLAEIARRMELDWTRQRAAVFGSALGATTLARMGVAHLARQGAKLIPGIGQTLGSAVAIATSTATTYALGRAAHAWLWGERQGTPADAATLRGLYAEALREAVSHAAG